MGATSSPRFASSVARSDRDSCSPSQSRQRRPNGYWAHRSHELDDPVHENPEPKRGGERSDDDGPVGKEPVAYRPQDVLRASPHDRETTAIAISGNAYTTQYSASSDSFSATRHARPDDHRDRREVWKCREKLESCDRRAEQCRGPEAARCPFSGSSLTSARRRNQTRAADHQHESRGSDQRVLDDRLGFGIRARTRSPNPSANARPNTNVTINAASVNIAVRRRGWGPVATNNSPPISDGLMQSGRAIATTATASFSMRCV